MKTVALMTLALTVAVLPAAVVAMPAAVALPAAVVAMPAAVALPAAVQPALWQLYQHNLH